QKRLSARLSRRECWACGNRGDQRAAERHGFDRRCGGRQGAYIWRGVELADAGGDGMAGSAGMEGEAVERARADLACAATVERPHGRGLVLAEQEVNSTRGVGHQVEGLACDMGSDIRAATGEMDDRLALRGEDSAVRSGNRTGQFT